MSVTALVFQKAVFVLRPLCLPNSCTRMSIVVSFPETSEKIAIKNERGRVNINAFVFTLSLHDPC